MKTVRTTPDSTLSRTRMLLGFCAVGLVMTGLLLRFGLPKLSGSHGLSMAADQLGSVFYTALIFVLIRFIGPRISPITAALGAYGISVGIELLQLTKLPATLASHFGPAALVFGTTFNALDFVGYAFGAILAMSLFGRLGAKSL